MDQSLLARVFAEDHLAGGIDSDGPVDLFLAELALTMNHSPAHRLFGLETLFEAADRDEHFKRLSELAGSINIFGLPDA